MSRLTALGWLAFYNYKDAAPTALRLGTGNFVRTYITSYHLPAFLPRLRRFSLFRGEFREFVGFIRSVTQVITHLPPFQST
jgi:hypothetical protein